MPPALPLPITAIETAAARPSAPRDGLRLPGTQDSPAKPAFGDMLAMAVDANHADDIPATPAGTGHAMAGLVQNALRPGTAPMGDVIADTLAMPHPETATDTVAEMAGTAMAGLSPLTSPPVIMDADPAPEDASGAPETTATDTAAPPPLAAPQIAVAQPPATPPPSEAKPRESVTGRVADQGQATARAMAGSADAALTPKDRNAAADRALGSGSGTDGVIPPQTAAKTARATAQSVAPPSAPTAAPDKQARGAPEAAPRDTRPVSPGAASAMAPGAETAMPAPAPTATMTTSTPLPVLSRADPAWPATLVETSLAALTRDGGTIEIAMNPGSLGALRITLTLDGDSARVAIRTETAEAAALLAEVTPDLARDFAAGGVTLDAMDSQPVAPAATPDEAKGDAARSRDGQRAPPWVSPPGETAPTNGGDDPPPPYHTLSRPLSGLLNLIA